MHKLDGLYGTVLEIDMNAGNNSLSIILPETSIKYLRAYIVDKGIYLAETKHPDIIFLNPLMPNIDGFEVYETLQSNQNTKHIPVIFYNHRLPEIEKKLKILSVPYLSLPVNHDELYKYLGTYLNS